MLKLAERIAARRAAAAADRHPASISHPGAGREPVAADRKPGISGCRPGASRTEIVFILDASGSMCGLETDTIGGFNGLVEQHRAEPGEAVVSTIVFSGTSRVLHDRVDIRKVPRLTAQDYFCSGNTALLDAVGGAVEHMDLVQRILPAGYKADKVLFVITTDGMENASRSHTYDQVKRLIEDHRAQGWEFLFIGANIDAAREAASIGIPREFASGYVADAAGTDVLFGAVCEAVRDVRRGCAPAADWKNALEEDVCRRG